MPRSTGTVKKRNKASMARRRYWNRRKMQQMVEDSTSYFPEDANVQCFENGSPSLEDMASLISQSCNDSEDTVTSKNISTSLLPEKSKVRYNQVYDMFIKWCTAKDIPEISENVMIKYFIKRAEVLKSPNSLWREYAILHKTICVKKNEDISKFTRLKTFIKQKGYDYQPRQLKTFKKEEIEKFLVEAPDYNYLLMKVVAIMMVTGGCRIVELRRMKFKDIDLKNDAAIVKMMGTKNTVQRKFVITNDSESSVDCLKLLKTYMELRPQCAINERFFFRYERGKCANQVVGRDAIQKIPKEIAKFLKLDNACGYTGRALRKSSAMSFSNVCDSFTKSDATKEERCLQTYVGEDVDNNILHSRPELQNTFDELQSSNTTFTHEDSHNSSSQMDCENDYKFNTHNDEIHVIDEVLHSPYQIKHEHISDEELTDRSTPSTFTNSLDSRKENNKVQNSKKNDTDLFFELVIAKVKQFSPYYRNLVQTKIFSLVQEMELEQIQQ